MALRTLVLFLIVLLCGCGEEELEVYRTSCPEVELGEYIGYLSIEGVDQEDIAYWGCVGSSCSGDYVKRYGVRVDRKMEKDTLKVCCGSSSFGRVDQVNVVVIK